MVQQLLVWALIVVLGFVAIIPIAYDARSDRIDPFSPQVWFSMNIFLLFGLAAAVHLYTNDFSFSGRNYGSPPTTTTIAIVLLAAIVGAIAFHAGYRWSGGLKVARRLPRFRRGWPIRRVLVVVAVLIVIGSLSYLRLRQLQSTQTAPELAKGTSKLIFIGSRFLRTAAILLLATIVIGAQRLWSRRPSHVPLEEWLREMITPRIVLGVIGVIGFVAVVVYAMYSLGLRAAAFGLSMITIALIHYLFRRFSLTELSIPYLFYVALPAWTLALFLGIASFDFKEVITTLTHPFFGLSSPHPPFNNIVILLNGMPEHLGYQYGTTFLSAFFAVVPIQPFAQTQTVYNHAFLPGAAGYGVPISLIGELYLNFWWIGIPVGMALFGVVLRAYYEWLINYDRSTSAYVLFAGVGSMFLLGGNFSNALPNLGLSALPLFVCLALIVGGLEQTRFVWGANS